MKNTLLIKIFFYFFNFDSMSLFVIGTIFFYWEVIFLIYYITTKVEIPFFLYFE